MFASAVSALKCRPRRGHQIGAHSKSAQLWVGKAKKSRHAIIVSMPNDMDPKGNLQKLIREKLAFLQAERILATDGSAKFKLDKEIEELQSQLETQVDISRLPTPGPLFIGREKELAQLDRAWTDDETNVITVVAWGGVGKSALLDRWLTLLAGQNWTGANAVFVWSFYSQGTEERLTSADAFIEAGLRFFGDDKPTEGLIRDRAIRLAKLVQQQRVLLILDGMEPLQEPPGPLGGKIRDPGVAALVSALALDNKGLLVISTRENVYDLQRHEGSSVQRMALDNFSEDDGAVLLSKLGVVGTEKERRETSAAYQGHALALSLLGTFLVKVYGGEIRKLPDVDVGQADKIAQGGHAWRVIAAYADWLGEREVSVLRLLGFFDKPAEKEAIAVLKAGPEIAGLNNGIIDMDDVTWTATLANLAECGLLPKGSNNEEFRPPLPAHAGALTEAGTSGERAGARGQENVGNDLDAHPLVRAYFAHHLEHNKPNAWQAGHERLYEHYKKAAPELPDTLDEMMPLYSAVVHGCKAGKHKEAFDDVYKSRIERGDEGYPTHKLGAFGPSLIAAGSFFVQRWTGVAPGLSDDAKAWLLNEAGFLLRGLGRLAEAVQPMEVGLQVRKDQELWPNAARIASNVSELSLTLGNVTRAVTSGEESVELAEKSGDAGMRMINRTTMADALHQAGRLEDAEVAFREAEALQEEMQPQYPRLYSLQGYQYCDLLLGRPDPGAWLALDGRVEELSALKEACEGVRERAAQTLEWAQMSSTASVLTISLDHLALGRAYLGLSLAPSPQPSPPSDALQTDSDRAGGEGAGTGRQRRSRSDNEYLRLSSEHLDEAVQGLRAAGGEDDLPRGLLARAAFHRIHGNPENANADLHEAEEIAERGGMLLHLADVHLQRTAFHLQFNENDEARVRLDQAVALIEACGYGRRRRDVESLEGVLASRNP